MKMKRFSRILMAMILSVMVCLQMAGFVSAAETDYETTYTVRILPGAQGTVGGGAAVYSGLHYGDTVSFSVSSVSLYDSSKYYAKGLKDSGKDNNHPTSDFKTAEGIYYLVTDGAGNYTITVTCDQDFVVTYGLKGSSVAYYVNYVDADGNTLVESNTYYGNEGDKPVISYVYIEGYKPQAYRLTKTLSADESQNVFTFTYSPIVQPQPETTTTQPATTVQPATTAAPAQTTTAQSEVVTMQGETTTVAGERETTRAMDNEETTIAQRETTTAAGQNGQQTTTAAGQNGQQTTTVAQSDISEEPEATQAAEQATTAAEVETETTTAEPLEIIDLDNEVPRGNIDVDENTENQSSVKNILTSPLVICGGAAVLIVIIILVVLYIIRNKKKK